MPDRDDIPDPMDEAYLRAEEALDDEAAHAARRARVLAAAAQDQATPIAATPAAPIARGPMRRYGGWLAAACIAGVSVITAGHVWRSTPGHQPSAPPAVQIPSPAAQTPKAQSSTAQTATTAPTAPPDAPPSSTTARSRSALLPAAPQGPRDEEAAPRSPAALAPPPPPPEAVVAPPPLPIPPVEKPIAPLQSVPAARPFAASPAPTQATAPAVAAKPGVSAGNSASALESVVVTGSRIARREADTQAPLISGPLKTLDGPARLRAAASAGRTAEIEAVLAQGVPVDAPDENGETALMKSIAAGRRDAAALLRRHGASLDQKNHAGVSARDMATTTQDAELGRALGLAR